MGIIEGSGTVSVASVLNVPAASISFSFSVSGGVAKILQLGIALWFQKNTLVAGSSNWHSIAFAFLLATSSFTNSLALPISISRPREVRLFFVGVETGVRIAEVGVPRFRLFGNGGLQDGEGVGGLGLIVFLTVPVVGGVVSKGSSWLPSN